MKIIIGVISVTSSEDQDDPSLDILSENQRLQRLSHCGELTEFSHLVRPVMMIWRISSDDWFHLEMTKNSDQISGLAITSLVTLRRGPSNISDYQILACIHWPSSYLLWTHCEWFFSTNIYWCIVPNSRIGDDRNSSVFQLISVSVPRLVRWSYLKSINCLLA